MALGKAGADRQEMHARLRQHALAAWEALRGGAPNPLEDTICNDPELLRYLPVDDLRACMDVGRHVGDAPERARLLVVSIRDALG